MIWTLAPLLVLTSAGQRNDTAITLEEARASPLAALAGRFLREAPGPLKEVAVYDRTGLPELRDALTEISFAGTPRSSGFAGICVVDTISVPFKPIDPFDRRKTPPSPTTAVRPDRPVATQRFRVLRGAQGGPVEASTRSTQEAQCVPAGPVLPQGSTDRGAAFFRAYGEVDAADVDMAVRALRQAQVEAADGAHAPECRRDILLPGDSMCFAPGAALTRLDWQRLEGMSIHRVGGEDKQRDITLYFKRHPGEAGAADHVHVEIVAEDRDGVLGRPDIESVKLVGVTYVD